MPREFWIIAGPNGSGKSTLYSQATISASLAKLWIINPDILARELADSGIAQANLEAVIRIETWLHAGLKCHASPLGVETVLSTDKYRPLVQLAKKQGFKFRFVYVILKSPELHVARVEARVQTGGHSVPTDKILERRHKSLEQFKWFFNAADDARVFDNSAIGVEGGGPVMIAAKTMAGSSAKALVQVKKDCLPEIAQRLPKGAQLV